MNHATRASTFALLLLLGAASRPAAAFSLLHTEQGKTVRWYAPEIPWVLQGVVPGVEDGDFESAMKASFQSWNDVPGTGWVLHWNGRIEGAQVGYDRAEPNGNNNLVTVYASEWLDPPTVGALTVTSYLVDTGQILDADIKINATTIEWGLGDPGRLDIQNALTHEVGHLLGLGHSATVVAATMFPVTSPGETEKRSLHPDDVAGVLALYGDGDLTGGTFTIPGDTSVGLPTEIPEVRQSEEATQVRVHCGVVPGEASSGGWLLLPLVWLTLRRRSTGPGSWSAGRRFTGAGPSC
jgi:hypothetical protein